MLPTLFGFRLPRFGLSKVISYSLFQGTLSPHHDAQRSGLCEGGILVFRLLGTSAQFINYC